jgi:hypothetical protein
MALLHKLSMLNWTSCLVISSSVQTGTEIGWDLGVGHSGPGIVLFLSPSSVFGYKLVVGRDRSLLEPSEITSQYYPHIAPKASKRMQSEGSSSNLS